MVTKQHPVLGLSEYCSVLAKIHMVTKQAENTKLVEKSSVLAKIHMVTKLQYLPNDVKVVLF